MVPFAQASIRTAHGVTLRISLMKGKLATLVLTVALANAHASNAQEGLANIKTIVVVYAENRSFDHLYGFFPGATG
jgi:phospholipase C